jgi:hypothetical protein
MADFTARAPSEPTKIGAYLHDRSNRPVSPRGGAGSLVKNYWGYVLGILLALGATALVIEARAAWESHRDWVPPAGIVPGILAGLALGHLLQRGRLNAAASPIVFAFLAVVFLLMDMWRATYVDGPDVSRDVLTVLGAICLAVSFVWLVILLLVTELRSPTRPPGPEI